MNKIASSTLTSNLHNCVVYNMLWVMKNQLSPKDILLLKNFRQREQVQRTVSYYSRSFAVVQRVKHRSDSLFVWISLYEQFGRELLNLVREEKFDQAAKQIESLLAHAEQYF